MGDTRDIKQAEPIDGSATYAKQGSDFKAELTQTVNDIDWATGMYKKITLTTNTDFTFSNVQAGKTLCIELTGEFAFTFAGTIPCGGGEYDGTKVNYLLFSCLPDSPEKIIRTIIQED